MLQMLSNGAGREAEDEGDLGVGLPLGDPAEDLGLATGKPEGFQSGGVEGSRLLLEEQEVLGRLGEEADDEPPAFARS